MYRISLLLIRRAAALANAFSTTQLFLPILTVPTQSEKESEVRRGEVTHM